jgi:hypothetical protein
VSCGGESKFGECVCEVPSGDEGATASSQYSTVYSTVQRSTVQYSTVQYSTVQFPVRSHGFLGARFAARSDDRLKFVNEKHILPA